MKSSVAKSFKAKMNGMFFLIGVDMDYEIEQRESALFEQCTKCYCHFLLISDLLGHRDPAMCRRCDYEGMTERIRNEATKLKNCSKTIKKAVR